MTSQHNYYRGYGEDGYDDYAYLCDAECQDNETDTETYDSIRDTRRYANKYYAKRERWIRAINNTSPGGLKLSDPRMRPPPSMRYADRISTIPLVYRPKLGECSCGIKPHGLPKNKGIAKGKPPSRCPRRAVKGCKRIVCSASINMMVAEANKQSSAFLVSQTLDTDITDTFTLDESELTYTRRSKPVLYLWM